MSGIRSAIPGAAAAALAFFLAGCAVGPTYRALPLPAATPAAWATELPHGGRVESLTAWWSNFGDPQLTKLIELAEKRSPTLEQAVARIQEARATTLSAGGSLNASATATHTRGATGEALSAISTRSLNLSWEVDVFGGQRRAVEAANARADAATLNWHQARISLAAEVASDYFSFRQCESAVRLGEQDQASLAKTDELTQYKVRAGAEPQSAADRTEAALADSTNALLASSANCKLAQHKLAALTAAATEELQDILGLRQALPSVVAIGFASLPAAIITQRPDVASAERAVAAASADIGVATADLLPSLSLSGLIGVNTAGAHTKSWSFGPSLSLPILNGGQQVAAIHGARARYDEAVSAWRNAVLSAIQDVQDALTRVDAAQRRHVAAQRAVDRYASFYVATQARFQAGAASLLELEEARRLHLSAQQSLLSVELEHAQARIALYKAAGGGWTVDTQHPTLDVK